MSEHFGVTGETPHQVARAESLREITDADRVRGRRIDLVAYLQDFWNNDYEIYDHRPRSRNEHLFRPWGSQCWER
jgi:hypothetical protein